MSDTQKTSALTLVLVGSQGSGKSSTGNTILKRKCFQCRMGTIATTKSESKEEMPHGENTITIVDTPPLSSKESLSAIKNYLPKHQQITAVYAIVIAIGRFTKDEEQVLNGLLSNSFLQGRTLFIFTRKNELESLNNPQQDKLEQWLDSEPTIQRWMSQYNIKNYFAIENTSTNNDGMMEMIDVAVNMVNHKKGNSLFKTMRSGVIGNRTTIQQSSNTVNCLGKRICRGGVPVVIVIPTILLVTVAFLVLVIKYSDCS